MENEDKVWHSPNEQPEFYTDKIVTVDKSAILIDPHSKYYTPTKEAQEELNNKLKNYKRWAYLHNLVR